MGGPAAWCELLTVPRTSDSCSRGHTTWKATANLENTWTSGAQSQALTSQLRMLLNLFIIPF